MGIFKRLCECNSGLEKGYCSHPPKKIMKAGQTRTTPFSGGAKRVPAPKVSRKGGKR
jgi:hypothetical protein